MSVDSLIGRQLDEYRLVALLGHGGMARVYRALDLNLKRFAAIKVIDTQHRDDPEYLVRFEREAQTIAQLDHPHIVRLYRYGNVDGLFYMAMQYIQGATLEYVLASYRADGVFIDPAEAMHIIKDVCLALDYAHDGGVIHRDVKPSNIILDRHGQAILTDFGLALLPELGTRGEILGSPHYVAPEQAISSANAVPQSDLYSLGVIIYEMFTGRPPFDAPNPLDVAIMQINDQPPPPSGLRPEISGDLQAVILKALSKQPAQRYASGQALAEALERALAAQPLLAPQAVPSTLSHLSIPEQVEREMARHPLPPPVLEAEQPPEPPAATGSLAPASGGAPGGTAGGASSRTRPMVVVGAGVGLGLVVLVLALCGLLALAARNLSQAIALAGTDRPTATRPAPTSTPTASPAPTTAPTASPAPTAVPPTAQVVTLLLVKGEDASSLVVINQATRPLPVAPLQLGKGRGSIGGNEWQLGQLDGGACLLAVQGGDNSLPDGVNCQQEGQTIRRQAKQRFWQATFDVYYQGADVGTCSGDASQCSVTISP